jgi:hypothetical protein
MRPANGGAASPHTPNKVSAARQVDTSETGVAAPGSVNLDGIEALHRQPDQFQERSAAGFGEQ